ncbi:MAG TPA: NADH-quinone oxidoreductase subunit C [Vicinamibacterales bacterium]|nr:NADH-quinone oxidoreductase subunit C [Vicinamibacterales bacterium]HOG27913.1 NADH-quinone oxidoreductase subunit C [Vicinamibacterales bacterium]HPK70881.1 NADH-quinone oxidoreductase subunit C [Vicinamibacterales bacterium]HPW21344.1 NADH-quinone oxidoreductase subunit C [Vicinamibacterales bacterium]
MNAAAVARSIAPDAALSPPDEGRLVVPVALGDWEAAARALHADHRLPLDLLWATDDRAASGSFGLHAAFALDASHEWIELVTAVPGADPVFPSITPRVMAAHWYERAVQDMFGLTAAGHPDPRRLVHHENVPPGTWPLRKDFPWDAKLPWAAEPHPLATVEGEGVFQVPVGPIHAGVIEPGHFRFSVAGERIITLEGKLFFTHKGVEKLLEGRTAAAAMPFVERVSGDSAASHALAFCQAVEAVARCRVPERARVLRVLAVELERFTMHLHDVANICGMGTGFTLLAAGGFRVKERLQRLSARLFGNRFFRGFVLPGGTARDLGAPELDDIEATLDGAWAEASGLFQIGLESDSLLDRLETTGVLSRDAAWAYGAKGIAARASGLDRDSRRDHPHAAYGTLPLRVPVRTEGDVDARVRIRLDEMAQARALVARGAAECRRSQGAPWSAPCEPADGDALGWTEGWRGQILDWVRFRGGVIDRAVVRDPSFCNWPLFGELGPGNIVPDFPLCNKSLNLSYSGTDL